MGANARLIDELRRTRTLAATELRELLLTMDAADEEALFSAAREVRRETVGDVVYLRGLIEFTNYCRNDCLYCGIRRSNARACRYRLSDEQILACCDQGHELGLRTFVLQGGEDSGFGDDHICALVAAIKERHPDCAVTLSIGEKSRESYARYFAAGADRYLLRHETSNPAHYRRLHPPELTIENRKRCLDDLRDIGYQVGCGIMVGSPYQTVDNVVEDLLYMRDFEPHMVGIGPFVPHGDTPFAHMPAGTLEDTLRLLAIVRLMLPEVLLPATTALGTIDPTGREKGIRAGANVMMPSLTPLDVRGDYLLYDGKVGVRDQAADVMRDLEERVEAAGCGVDLGRGDHPGFGDASA